MGVKEDGGFCLLFVLFLEDEAVHRSCGFVDSVLVKFQVVIFELNDFLHLWDF